MSRLRRDCASFAAEAYPRLAASKALPPEQFREVLLEALRQSQSH